MRWERLKNLVSFARKREPGKLKRLWMPTCGGMAVVHSSLRWQAIRCCYLLLILCCAGAAYGQAGSATVAYPTKPIRIVAAEAGGQGDFTARIIAPGIAGPLGQPVIVESKGGGVIPAQIVAQSTADGYTLILAATNLWIGSLLQKTPYDPVRDFAPVTTAVSSPNVLVVHPSLPVKSVNDLIALAKSRPTELNYGSGASGGSSHLAAELFCYMAKVKMTRIPYKGNTPALVDVLAGQLQLMFPNSASGMTHIKAGRLKGLAATSSQPSTLLPGLPTISATGLPGYELVALFGILAPAKTPPQIVSRLNQEIVRFLKTPEVKVKFFAIAVEVVASSPDELAAAMKTDMVNIGKLVKAANIRAD
jgi:tripartite-type tricarboxylate transporter receptor subunit TctC